MVCYSGYVTRLVNQGVAGSIPGLLNWLVFKGVVSCNGFELVLHVVEESSNH